MSFAVTYTDGCFEEREAADRGGDQLSGLVIHDRLDAPGIKGGSRRKRRRIVGRDQA